MTVLLFSILFYFHLGPTIVFHTKNYKGIILANKIFDPFQYHSKSKLSFILSPVGGESSSMHALSLVSQTVKPCKISSYTPIADVIELETLH